MKFRDKVFTAILSISMLNWMSHQHSGYNTEKWEKIFDSESEEVSEVIESWEKTPISSIEDIEKGVNNQIYLCLETDSPDTFTHTKVLESVTEPENTILEYPVNQLFQKYWANKNSHPLAVSWVAKKIRSLLWKGGIEASDIPQKLSPRKDDITSETLYEIWDTLRFALIDHRLKWAFPEDLSEQLKEEWFETFFDKDSLEIGRIQRWEGYKKNIELNVNWDSNKIDSEESLDNWYIYDIVVKSLPWWKSALAVYRNWKLFMATYVSIWTPWHKTRRWQYEIIWKFPYKRSTKYDNAAMPLALNFYWWYYFHQRHVTWYPLSHGCVGQPWCYADVTYSLVLHEDHVDVFIDNNLYKTKK